jgi:hypothetical protein
VPLIVVGLFPHAVQRVTAFPGDAQQAKAISAASQMIERATPGQPITLSVAGANGRYCHRLAQGLAWEMNADGYQPQLVARPTHGQRIPQVTVLLRSDDLAVDVTSAAGHVPAQLELSLSAPLDSRGLLSAPSTRSAKISCAPTATRRGSRPVPSWCPAAGSQDCRSPMT